MMSQCFSGGFNQAVIDASPAQATFIAAATSARQSSFMTLDDGNWDSFQRNWIAGLAGHDVDGAAVAAVARNGAARGSVGDAFAYASTCSRKNPYDSPEYAARPETAGEMTLSEY